MIFHHISIPTLLSYSQEVKTVILLLGVTLSNIEDFWRMIWEVGITTIVMVTNEKEQDKVIVSKIQNII